MENQKVKKNWKQKLIHEFTEYWINVVYMALFFSAVVLYRRLLLAEHGIYLDDYFAGVLKALVFAKVIMIGGFIRFSRKYEHMPLIIPTIYKAILFTLWVMLFDIIEIYIRAFIHTPDFAEAFSGLKNHINMVWLGAAVVICVSFLPFFAMKEVSRVMGSDKFRGLFFKKQG
jgi:hypothetical protein